MKKQTPLVLSIPQPCSQSWDEMAIAGSEGFCSYCRHTVTDISGMSDKAVYQLAQQGNLRCVRALSSQLNRNIHLPQQKTTPLYRIAIALGLAILTTSSNDAFAQPKAPLLQYGSPGSIADERQRERLGKDSIKVTGSVLDEKSEPFPGVIIKLVEGGLIKGATVTEDDGSFVINAVKGEYELQAIATGYITEKLLLEQTAKLTDLILKLRVGAPVIFIGMLMENRGGPIKNEPGKTTIEDEELRRMGY